MKNATAGSGRVFDVMLPACQIRVSGASRDDTLETFLRQAAGSRQDRDLNASVVSVLTPDIDLLQPNQPRITLRGVHQEFPLLLA